MAGIIITTVARVGSKAVTMVLGAPSDFKLRTAREVPGGLSEVGTSDNRVPWLLLHLVLLEPFRGIKIPKSCADRTRPASSLRKTTEGKTEGREVQ